MDDEISKYLNEQMAELQKQVKDETAHLIADAQSQMNMARVVASLIYYADEMHRMISDGHTIDLTVLDQYKQFRNTIAKTFPTE